MRHLDAAGQHVADRERRARDRPLDAERTRRAPHEGGLAAAELAGDEHDVARERAAAPARRPPPRSPPLSASRAARARRAQPNRSICGGSGSGTADGCGRRDRPDRHRRRLLEQRWDAREGGAQVLERLRRAQRRRGMEDRIHPHRPPAQLMHLGPAVHGRDAAVRARDDLHGELAERADEPRLDQLDLPVRVGLAGRDLVGQRVAVAGWAAAHDIRHEHVLARQADLLEQLVEQLAGAAHEGKPLDVLLLARALTDEHQAGVRVAVPEHHSGAALVQRAAQTAGGLAVEGDELFAPLRCGSRLHGRQA